MTQRWVRLREGGKIVVPTHRDCPGGDHPHWLPDDGDEGQCGHCDVPVRWANEVDGYVPQEAPVDEAG